MRRTIGYTPGIEHIMIGFSPKDTLSVDLK